MILSFKSSVEMMQANMLGFFVVIFCLFALSVRSSVNIKYLRILFIDNLEHQKQFNSCYAMQRKA